MAILKQLAHSYPSEIDLINCIYYILNPVKTHPSLINTNNVICLNPLVAPDIVSSQMIAVQKGQSLKSTRRMYHFVFSPDYEFEPSDPHTLYSIGIAFQMLYPKYQSLFAIHANTKHIHLHLIYNNIPVWGNKQLSKILNISTMENLADLILIDMSNRKMQNRAAGISPISIAKAALQILYHGYC